MAGEKQDTTTGRLPESTPILAGESAPMAAPLTPAPPKIESASTRVGLILALLQTDFFDLQSKGLKVAILAKDGKLFASLEYQGHAIGFEDGEILLDGAKVSEA